MRRPSAAAFTHAKIPDRGECRRPGSQGSYAAVSARNAPAISRRDRRSTALGAGRRTHATRREVIPGGQSGGDHAATRNAAARRRRQFRLGCAVLLTFLARVSAADVPRASRAFTPAASADWLNSAPLVAARLHGRPVLVEVWTHECSNCRTSQPWLQRIADAYRSRGLVLVGGHSPEPREEHDPAHVAAAVRRLGMDYPAMLDEDFGYWRSLGNRYWPAYYLIDASGKVIAARHRRAAMPAMPAPTASSARSRPCCRRRSAARSGDASGGPPTHGIRAGRRWQPRRRPGRHAGGTRRGGRAPGSRRWRVGRRDQLGVLRPRPIARDR